jgi:integrase
MRQRSPTGGPYTRLSQRAGIPRRVCFHGPRLTCATLLLLEGAHPRLVRVLLGHASIPITTDTNGHVLPGMDGGLMDMMGAAPG